jgi:hypothetical protein
LSRRYLFLVQLHHYHHHHYQFINVPTAGAQAFPMDHTQGERVIHKPPRGSSADWWVLTTANAAGTHGLTCLPKHGGYRGKKFLVSYPMTEQRCLTSAIARRSALTAGP